jgi:hypothetical protein
MMPAKKTFSLWLLGLRAELDAATATRIFPKVRRSCQAFLVRMSPLRGPESSWLRELFIPLKDRSKSKWDMVAQAVRVVLLQA